MALWSSMLKIDIIWGGNHWMVSRTLLRAIISEHNLLPHPQMQVKTLPCREKTSRKLPTSLGSSFFKADLRWRTAQTKEESYCQHTYQKLASVISWGCISAHLWVNNNKWSIQTMNGFYMDSVAYVGNTIPTHILNISLTTASLCSVRAQVLNWSSCSPNLPFI